MAPRLAPAALRHIRRVVAAQTTAALSDRQLLERFVLDHDEAAFAVLLRRHGPMVLNVAQRVLHDWQAAEDVFQAVFLVLARKAASIRKQDALSSWLHGVAHRLALKARHAARPRQLPAPAAPAGDPLADLTLRELRPVLDEELDRLSAQHRAPLVLCYLEGKTRDEAAQLLGWTLSTLKRRLDRAREVLRSRLARRGLDLSAVLAPAFLLGGAAPDVRAALLDNTLRAALAFSSGPTAAASAQALALAEGMLTTMIPTKFKLLGVLLVALGLLGTGARWLVQPAAVAQAPDKPPAAAPAPAPAAPEKPKLADSFGDPLPAHALARLGTVRWRHGTPVYYLGFTAEGKQLVTASHDGIFRVWDVATGKELRRFGPGDGEGMVNTVINVNGANAMIRVGNSWPTVAVALSADGTTLASTGTQSDAIQLWDVATGKKTSTVTTEKQGAANLLFMPDGKSLFAQAGDGSVREYDIAAGKERRKLYGPREGRPFAGSSITLSPDGKFLADVSAGLENNTIKRVLQLWDLAEGKAVHRITVEGYGNLDATFSPDSKLIAWPGFDGSIIFYDVATGKQHSKLTVGERLTVVSALAFAPDSKTVAVKSGKSGKVSQDAHQAVRLWELATGKEIRQMGDKEDIDQLGVRFQVLTIGGPARAATRQLVFSPDGKVLAAGGPSNLVHLWDTATGKELASVGGHRGAVRSVALALDGKTVTTHGADGTVRQWDAATGKERSRAVLPEGAVSVVVSPDGETAAVACSDQSLRLIATADGKELHKLKLPEVKGPLGLTALNGLAFSPDGKVLAGRVATTLHLWETASGKELRTISEDTPAPAGAPGAVVVWGMQPGLFAGFAFAPDGSLIASISSTGGAMPQLGKVGVAPQAPVSSLRLWHVGTGKLAARYELPQGVTAFAFAPDGRTIATINSDRSVSIWELTTGKERGKFKGPATALSFAADGRTLVTAGSDKTVHLWNVADGKELGSFTGHQGDVLAVAFSADGNRVISGSNDTSALVWDAAPLRKAAPVSADLDAKAVESLWVELTDADAAKAYRAIVALGQAPKQALPLLGERLKPAAGADAKRLEQLIADLNSETFAVRQKAADELEKLGELAEPALKRVLDAQPTLEVRQRVERLLERLVGGKAPPPELLRTLRALEVLEHLGTLGARQLLEKLGQGAEGARVTREARAALERLNRTR